MKTVAQTIAESKPFVPKKQADNSELSLPMSERIERFNARFKGLLDGATNSDPSQEKPWWYSLRKEPKEKE